MNDYRDILYAAFGFGFGIWSFFKGFKRLNEKRLIENTPASTVRGLAMGLVELTGKVQKDKILKSPLTGTECVFYRYITERYESRGRSGSWVVIASGDSTYCPFLLDDGTGKIMVLPMGAELVMPANYQFETGFGNTLPDNLVVFMENNGLNSSGIFGNYKLRFREWYIMPYETVFVLGTAQKTINPLSAHQETLTQRLTELKENTGEKSGTDLNKDITLDEDAWNKIAAGVEKKLLEEEQGANLKDQGADPQEQGGDGSDIIITKGDAGQTFVISDESQTQIVKNFSWQIVLKIFGGAALSLATLAYMLFRLHIGIRF